MRRSLTVAAEVLSYPRHRRKSKSYCFLGKTASDGNDANNPHMPPVHPRMQTLVHQSLDYLWVVEGSTRVSVRAKGIADLSIDGHNSPWAVLDLSDKH